MAEYDGGYKELFSHPEMVADLLRDFVREDWVQELDFSTLEKVPGSYVTPELSSWESDVVWRVRWGSDRQLYVYLLIELQSSIDSLMALRMMVYLGLLYQDLSKRRELTRAGKLPPILPLVLYNGFAPWSAAQEIAELIEEVPGGLERYRPRFRYCLLDEMRMADSKLESLRNLAAGLFRLEKSRSPQDLQPVLAALIEWLREPGLEELRKAFATYLIQVLLPARVPGVEMPMLADLQEVKSMLAERVMDWTQQWKQEGLEEGRQEGLQRGLQEGRQEALEEALGEVRTALLQELERRFGPLPEELRRRVEGIASLADLTAFSVRAGSASSLDELS